MPFSKTFFSKGFGMGIDRFGIPWMVNSPPRATDRYRSELFLYRHDG